MPELNGIEYEVVDPHHEFIDPSKYPGYMEFLEYCIRICYKSEPTDEPAEKFVRRISSKHVSVLEHANCIMDIKAGVPDKLLFDVLGPYNNDSQHARRLFVFRASKPDAGVLRLSGNLRMWMELMDSDFVDVGNEIAYHLHQKWPAMFPIPMELTDPSGVRLLDENPLTNKDGLPVCEMMKHMTLTCNLVGDRTMSHQLVRHRISSYSQESQRFCDYGKKGFKFIVPPKILSAEPRIYNMWLEDTIDDYRTYLALREVKIPSEDARSKLPNATKTEVVTTNTLGIWDHVFNQRPRNPKAQWQIKATIGGAEKEFTELLPEVFNEPHCKCSICKRTAP
jgi:thymidylate synthase (FAD)